MLRIAFFTVARSDLSYLLQIIRLIDTDCTGEIVPIVCATGSHYDQQSGLTISCVRKAIAGMQTVSLVELDPCEGASVSPERMSESILCQLVDSEIEFDVCVVLGDRFELLPIANYCVLNRKPICHIYGGECSRSFCLDTQVRDALTKMAHIHFVSHDDTRKRLMCMGEEERRIHVVGNLSVSAIEPKDVTDCIFEVVGDKNLSARPLVNVCYHPVTIDECVSDLELEELFKALDQTPQYFYVWSGVNTDPGSAKVRRRIGEFLADRDNHMFSENLGSDAYFSLLKNAHFMIGNSSSGLLEAGRFRLPVVNVGMRQGGRLHGNNTVSVPASKHAILEGMACVQKMERNSIEDPFFLSTGVAQIADVLANVKTFPALMKKVLQCDGPAYELSEVPDFAE